jgi:hypothetical protein
MCHHLVRPVYVALYAEQHLIVAPRCHRQIGYCVAALGFPRCNKIAAYAFFLIFKNIALTSDNLNAFSRWPWYSLSTMIRWAKCKEHPTFAG